MMRIRLMLAVFFALLSSQLAQAASQARNGFVYIATNDPGANSVIQFKRSPDGSLTKIDQVRTRGLGGVAMA